MLPGTAKTIRSPLALLEIIHYVETNLHDGYHYELRNALHRVQQERRMPPIPARYEYLSLIIRIDQSHQIAHYNAMLVAQAGAREHQCGEPGVGQVHRNSGRDEVGFSRLNRHDMLDASAQVEACGTGGRIGGQLVFQAWIENLDIYFLHELKFCYLS